MTRNHSHNPLRQLLRAGDPAADAAELAPGERAAIKARMLAAAAERPPSAARWLAPAATVAALLALALGLASRHPVPPVPTAAEPPAAAREIQFTTANGTLVVWQLLPSQSS